MAAPQSSPPPSTQQQNVLSLIGNTPLLKLVETDTGPCELFLKLENQNPGGSIKDRIGLSMIEAAEREGKLHPGHTLVEATAGNTGLALALVAARKGYRLLLVIPDKMSQEKIFHLRAMGAEVRMTRSDVGKGHPEYYQDLAERLARECGGFYVNQFENQANPYAHETTTGPEIFRQMAGRVDAVVCGVGSGGTVTGLSRYFARVAPDAEMVLADPKGSVLDGYVKTGKLGTAGSWLVEGVGEDFLPPICDLSRVRHSYSITDEESFLTARALLKQEGILGGSSTGLLVAAALRYCRTQTTKKRVVSFVCDSGNKYLSKMYNDFWMREQGYLRGAPQGDLRDVMGRSAEQHAVIVVAPEDRLLVAYSRMKLYDVSQLPVLTADERIVGILDESDLLYALHDDQTAFQRPVSSIMSTKLETVQVNAKLDSLWPIFERGLVVIVCDGPKFLGLITRIDLLNYLRRKVS
jgi:cystathionine beta-synthase